MSEIPALYGQYDDEGNPLWMDNAVRLMFAIRAENARLRAALAEISRQLLLSEMGAEQADYADFEAGYEACVECARTALKNSPEAIVKSAQPIDVIGAENQPITEKDQ